MAKRGRPVGSKSRNKQIKLTSYESYKVELIKRKESYLKKGGEFAAYVKGHIQQFEPISEKAYAQRTMTIKAELLAQGKTSHNYAKEIAKGQTTQESSKRANRYYENIKELRASSAEVDTILGKLGVTKQKIATFGKDYVDQVYFELKDVIKDLGYDDKDSVTLLGDMLYGSK